MRAPAESQLYPKIMAVSIFCLVLVSFTGLAAAQEWPQFQADANNTGYLETSGITGSVQEKWSHSVTSSSPTFNDRPGPAYSDGRVFSGSTSGYLTSVYADSGNENWSNSNIAEVYTTPVVTGDKVFVAGGIDDSSTLFMVNKTTGTIIDQDSTPYTIFGITYSDGMIYYGDYESSSKTGGIYAKNTSNFATESSTGLSNHIWGSPVVGSKYVYATTYNDGVVHAFYKDNLSEVWSEPIDSGTSSNAGISPTLYEGKVIAARDDGKISAVNASTGSKVWGPIDIGDLEGSPSAYNGHFFIGDANNEFHKINASTGTIEDSISLGDSALSGSAVANGKVYFANNNPELFALETDSFSSLWNYTLPDFLAYSGPAVVNGEIYMTLYGNNILALEGESADGSPPGVTEKNLVDRTDFNGVLKDGEKVSVYANITDESGIDSATADLSQFGAGSSVPLSNETSTNFDWDGDGTLEGDIYGANATVDGASTTDGTSKSATITATDASSMSNTVTTSEFGSLTVDTVAPDYRNLNVSYVSTQNPIFRANFSEETSGLDGADTEVEVVDSSGSLFDSFVDSLSDIFVQGKEWIIFDFGQRPESLQEGLVDVNITAEDVAGNTAGPHTENFTVDTTPPYNFSLVPDSEVFRQSSENFTLDYSYNELNPNYTEISIIDQNSNTDASIEFSESGENPDGSFEFDLDNSSYSLTADETYDVKVFAEDLAGNTNSTTSQDLLTIDDTPPVLNQSIKISDTEFEFNVSDNQALNSSSIAQSDFEYKTPGVSGSFSVGSCPEQVTNCTVSALLDSEVDIYSVKAGVVPGEDVRDAAGNIQIDDNVTINGMDGVPPEIDDKNLSDASDNDNIVTGGDKVKVYANVTDGVKVETVTANLTEFGLGDVTLESESSSGKDWNGNGVTEDDYYGANSTVSDTAADGAGKSSWITASDNSSNTNTSLEFGNLEIDNTLPEVNITDPLNSSPVYITSDDSLNVNFTYTEQNPEYANLSVGPSSKLFDGLSSGTDVELEKTFSSSELPGEGVYDVNITLNDSVGQEGEDGELNTVFIDDTPPGNVSNLRHEDKTANEGYDDDQKVDFNWTAAEDDISGVDYYRVYNSTDGGSTYSDSYTIEDTNYTVSAVNGDKVVLKVQAVDRAGNIGDNKTSETVTVDTQPPQVNIYTPLSGDKIVNEKEQTGFRVNGTIENDLSGNITINVSDENSEVSRQDVGFAEGNFSLEIDISILSDGGIDVEATANDEAGNTGDTSTEQATKDTVAPDFPEAYRINNTWVNTTLNDTGVGLKPSSIEGSDYGVNVGSISGVDISAVTSGESRENVTVKLNEEVDSDTVTVSINGKIQDEGENNLTSGSQTVSGMDGVPPDFAQKNLSDATDGDGQVSQGDKVTVSAVVTDGETVSVVEANLTELGAGNSVSMTSESDAGYDWDNDSSTESDVYGVNATVGSVSSPTGGEANATITGEDNSGNSNTSVEFGQLVLDDTPPAINSIDNPTNESPVYLAAGDDFEVKFNYTEENPDHVNMSLEGAYQLNNSFTGGTNKVVSRTFLHENTPAQDGYYNLTVTMNDTSGLEGSLTEWKPVAVDETNPSSVSDLQHYDETANQGYDDDKNVTFNWSEAVDDTSGVENYSLEISRDGDSTFEDSAVISGSRTEYNVSAQGGDNVSIKVQAIDRAGNTGPETESSYVKVDETPPSVTIYDPLAEDNIVNSAEETTLEVNGTIQNDNMGEYDLRANDSSSTVSRTGLSFSEGNFSAEIDVSSLADGEITVRVTPTDEAGNTGDTAFKPLTKDSQPPVFSDANKENLTAINATFEDVTTGLNDTSITASDFSLDTGSIDSIDHSWVSSGDVEGNVTIYLKDKVDADQITVDIVGEIKDIANNNLTSGSQTVSGMDGVPPNISEKNLSDATDQDGVVIEGDKIEIVAKVTDGDYISRVDANLTEFGASDQVAMISENIANYDWDGDGSWESDVYGANATVGSNNDVTGGIKNVTVEGEDGSGNVNVSEPFGELEIDDNPPEISGFNTSAVADEDASGEDFLIYFNSSQQLSGINVSVEDPGGVYSYLNETEFSEQAVTGGYNYSSIFDADKTGVYNATLLTAEDVNGLNGSNHESSESTLDNENPQVEEIEILDRDQEGDVDAANITFTKAINDSTVVANDWNVSGQDADSYDTGTKSNDNKIQIRLSDGNEIPGTDAKNVTYRKDEPEDSDIEGLNGNELDEVAESFDENDSARPLAEMTVSTDPIYDNELSQDVTVTYTEPMNQTVNPVVEFTGTEGSWTEDSASWNSPEEFSATYSITDEEEETTATVSVRDAEDPATNLQFENSTNFEVDTETPNASTVLNGSQVFSGTSVNLTEYFNHSTGDGESTLYEYEKQGGGFDPISNPESWDSTQSGDGEHTFYLTVTDDAGNTNTTFGDAKVDNNPPADLSIDSPTVKVYRNITNSLKVEYSYTEANPNKTVIRLVDSSGDVDAIIEKEESSSDPDSQVVFDLDNQGYSVTEETYDINLTAEDDADRNSSVETQEKLTVDNTAPVLKNPEVNSGTELSFDVVDQASGINATTLEPTDFEIQEFTNTENSASFTVNDCSSGNTRCNVTVTLEKKTNLDTLHVDTQEGGSFRDIAGNMNASAQLQFTGTDALPPGIESLELNTSRPVSEAEKGKEIETLVKFNESMNTSREPTVKIEGLDSTFDVTGSYENSTYWNGTFLFNPSKDYEDDEVDGPFSVPENTEAQAVFDGAEDSSGNSVVAGDNSAGFGVDTLSPIVDLSSMSGEALSGSLNLTNYTNISYNDGGTTTYSYSIDGGSTWTEIGSPESWDSTVLSDGQAIVRVNDTDDAENFNSETAAITVDNTEPEVNVNRTVVLEGEEDVLEDGQEFELIVNGSDQTSGVAKVEVNVSEVTTLDGFRQIYDENSDGNYTQNFKMNVTAFKEDYTPPIRIHDEAGNVRESATSPINVTSDPINITSEAIETVIETDENGNGIADIGDTVELRWNSSKDNISDVKKVEANFSNVGGPTTKEALDGDSDEIYTASHTLESGSFEGSFKGSITATDDLSRTDTENSSSNVQVDNNPPGTPQNRDADYAKNGRINVSWDPPSDTDVMKYVVYRKQKPGIEYEELGEFTASYVVDGPFSHGDYYGYKIQAIDDAGNRGVNTSEVALKADARPPEIESAEVKNTDGSNSVSKGGEVNVSIFTIDNPSLVKRVRANLSELGLDSEVELTSRPQNRYWDVFEISSQVETGELNVTYNVTDNAGHYNTTSDSVFIDTTPPSIEINEAENQWFTEKPELDIDFRDNIGIGEIRYRLGSRENFTLMNGTVEGNLTRDWELNLWENSSEGENLLYFNVTDEGGNYVNTSNESEAFTFRKDTVTPGTYDNHTQGWNSTNQTVEINETDETSGALETEYCLGESCTPDKAYTEPLNISNIGVNILRYNSTDVAGNTQSVQEVEVKIDRMAPNMSDASIEVVSGEDQVLEEGEEFRVSVNVSENTSYIPEGEVKVDLSRIDKGIRNLTANNSTIFNQTFDAETGFNIDEFTPQVTAADAANNQISTSPDEGIEIDTAEETDGGGSSGGSSGGGGGGGIGGIVDDEDNESENDTDGKPGQLDPSDGLFELSVTPESKEITLDKGEKEVFRPEVEVTEEKQVELVLHDLEEFSSYSSVETFSGKRTFEINLDSSNVDVGTYSGSLEVQAGDKVKEVSISIEVTVEAQNRADLKVNTSEKKVDYRYVFEESVRSSGSLETIIYNSTGGEVASEEKEVSINGNEFQDAIKLKDVEPGNYRIETRLETQGKMFSGSEEFKLGGEKSLPILPAFAAVILLGILIALVEYRNRVEPETGHMFDGQQKEVKVKDTGTERRTETIKQSRSKERQRQTQETRKQEEEQDIYETEIEEYPDEGLIEDAEEAREKAGEGRFEEVEEKLREMESSEILSSNKDIDHTSEKLSEIREKLDEVFSR